MKFMKYRHKWSASLGKWEYRTIDESWINDGVLDEWILEEMASPNDWSEHYRGMDYQLVERPPDNWLAKEISIIDLKMKSLQDRREELVKLK